MSDLTFDDFVPALAALGGLFVLLFGGRVTRLYCFCIGFVLGTSFTYWWFEPQIDVRHVGVPLIVGLLVSLFGGITCLLLHMFSMSCILGYTMGSILMVLDNGLVLREYRTTVYLIALVGAIAYTLRHPHHALLVTTAASGALILTLSIDSYSTRSLGAIIFQDTFLEYRLEVESSVARCFTWQCWLLIPFWFVASVCGYLTQYYSHHLRVYEAAWPMLFIKPKRANFTSSSTTRSRQAQTEALLGEDKNYTMNYSSYENFQKIQQAQQAQQNATQAFHQASHASSSSSSHVASSPTGTAAPELGSAHADDKVVLPPSARASFNFLEMKRLPPQYQYLYAVIQNSFQGLVRTYGFQSDNMHNQYEHLIFLLSNYQNKPSINTSNIVGSGGSASDTPTAGSTQGIGFGASTATSSSPTSSPSSANNNLPSNGDYISQLHSKLFTNYREWIAYMAAGGNSALGGSAITIDAVPLAKSQIADAKVDKNTTDTKIEEICLWLLVWGEAGSLRHTPECLAYIFHSLASENRKYQARFGGGFLESSVNSTTTHPYRPKRNHGDFLQYVITPIYDVIAEENKKSDENLRRNYDDLNEFFWRKSCLTYYYATKGYKIEADDLEVGDATSEEDSHATRPSRSHITVSSALRVAKKSYIEKRSWVHPIRSFMRLISFYGVCFHLLVCIAYISYINQPILGYVSNKILSSFVISLALYSVMKEFLEVWAMYGIISESIWNSIGFIIRLAIKLVMFSYLLFFYTWSTENPRNPVLQDEYYHAYILLSCIYLLPVSLSLLTQLFPTLSSHLHSLHIPFIDELGKFWYPIQKQYVGRDIHEPERAIYKYQVFWILLLAWKMYMSLLFQISPLIQPTMDILAQIELLSRSTKLWIHYLYYLEIVVMWAPFLLVYMFDTIIWYFLWQAVMGILVGMRVRLGEIREFNSLIACFIDLPKQFDRKIIYSKKKEGMIGIPVHQHQERKRRSSLSSPMFKGLSSSNGSTPNISPNASGPSGEREPLLGAPALAHSYQQSSPPASTATTMPAGQNASLSPTSITPPAPNLTAPLSTARGRRGSVTAITNATTAVAAFNTVASLLPEDPFRNRAWENFAVVWNEIVEDLRLGDLISNSERGMLRFRFDTTSEKEYYLPLFLMVGHIDSSIEKCLTADTAWRQALASGDGLDSNGKTRRERDLISAFTSTPIRKECVREMWEHLGWILHQLLGEKHQVAIDMILSNLYELLIVHQHVLRGTNLSALVKVKADLLNLVRGLRIASASYATLRLAEAERERKSAEQREREEREEQEREEKRREELEAEAEQEEEEMKQKALSASTSAAASADESPASSDDDSSPASSSASAKRAARGTAAATSASQSRTRLIRDAERSSFSQGSLARAREFNLKSMLKSPSTGTLAMLEKLQSRPRHRSAAFVPGSSSSSSSTSAKEDTGYLILHISLIRDQISALLNSLASCLDGKYNTNLDHHSNHASTSTSKPNPDVPKIIAALKAINTENEGFMWNSAYAGKQIHTLLRNAKTNTVLSTVHSLLTIASIDAEPRSPEAIRRLLFFANSLFMDLPVAPSIRAMKSLSTLTPFHSEDILYSFSDLEKKTEDGVSVFFYLQTIYPYEWQNFLSRCGINEDAFNSAHGTSILSNNKKWNMEARLWATMRGQTLGRTVDGMMLYEKALKLLLKIEEPELTTSSNTPDLLDDSSLLIQQKYQYVVSCQVYGKQKRENDPKAGDIEFLLHRYPSLRVAYIDTLKIPTQNGQQVKITEVFDSVLIKSERSPVTGVQEIKEVYRIRLPGNPMLGEGKPENQNHAIIFTRGEYLQTIDMNQSNYLEEALKMRNLLEEFNVAADEKRVAIVGFREHIYTGGLSSVANFMALQEGCFVTQGQRVLDQPLRVRFHYGHPDAFDKLFFMSRGGVSKASRGINLSEDIFAGFNSVLRGGSIKFREYIQCGKGRDVGLQQLFKFEAKLAQGNSMQSISRDIYRIANTVDFFRLLSFFFGGVGFYLTNVLTIWALYLFIYTRLILGGFRLESLDSFSGANTISYWFGMIGFLLTIPVFATIGLERGFRRGFFDVFRMIVTGGPLFFMFQMGTKHHFFEQTMLAGGAKYRPTGRGFVTRHELFAEIYRFHAASHFYRSVEMLVALILYLIVIPSTYSYSLVTWAAWMIVAAWLFGPFWFNPLAFEWEKTLIDFTNFQEWMSRREGDGDRSWKVWWKDENSYISTLKLSTRLFLAFFQLRYILVACSLIYYIGAVRSQVYVSGMIFFLMLLVVLFVRQRYELHQQFIIRILKAVCVVAIMIALLYLAEFGNLTSYQYLQYFISLISLVYIFHSFCNILLYLGLGLDDSYLARTLRQWFKLIDWSIAGLIFCILGGLSVTVIPGVIQTRLMFHNAFSRGVLIDKLLKTKPDDVLVGSAAATGGGGKSGASSSSGGGYGSSGLHRRRKDGSRGASKSDSPESDVSPENGASLSHTAGFDLDAISFIERRGAASSSSSKHKKKVLHPSKSESASDEQQSESTGRSKKKHGSVSFASSSSSGGSSLRGKAPSITNLDDLVEDNEDYPSQAASPAFEPSPKLHPQHSSAAAQAAMSNVMKGSIHLSPHMNARPLPSALSSNLSVASSGYPTTKSAGSTPTSNPSTVLPLYGAPSLNTAAMRPVPMARANSDHAYAVAAASQAGMIGVGTSPSPHLPLVSSGNSVSSHSSSGRESANNSPAPGSPHLAGLRSGRSADKLIGGLPTQALQDERPIPKTVLPTSAAQAGMMHPQNIPTTVSPMPNITNSPLNPRRG